MEQRFSNWCPGGLREVAEHAASWGQRGWGPPHPTGFPPRPSRSAEPGWGVGRWGGTPSPGSLEILFKPRAPHPQPGGRHVDKRLKQQGQAVSWWEFFLSQHWCRQWVPPSSWTDGLSTGFGKGGLSVEHEIGKQGQIQPFVRLRCGGAFGSAHRDGLSSYLELLP